MMVLRQFKIDHDLRHCEWLGQSQDVLSKADLTYADIARQLKTPNDSCRLTLRDIEYVYARVQVTPNIDVITLEYGLDSDSEVQAVNLNVFNLANTLLATCQSEKDICLQGVKFMKDMIGIDRAGILVVSEDREHVIGTWGTDERGNISDEADLCIPLKDNHWMMDSLQRPGQLIVKDNVPLTSYSKVVGTGWNAIISIYQDKQPLGWLCCDNLLTGRPLTESLRAQISLIGSILGQWMIRISHESKLNHLNELLEAEVKLKTKDLNATIAELKKTQNDLIHTERTKALSTFTAGVAHEINNPIGFIRSNLSFIGKVSSKVLETLKPLSLDELEKPIVLLSGIDQVIDESVDGLDRVKDIIQMLQPLNKLSDEEPQSFDIVQAVSFAVSGLPEHSVAVTIEDSVEDTSIELPMQIFMLALENILENALHAVDGAENPEIKIGIVEQGDEVQISVQDNGHGIEDEKIKDIFLPFFTTRSPGEGMGLGLALSQSLVQLAGGNISVTSKSGLGSTFKIHFNRD